MRKIVVAALMCAVFANVAVAQMGNHAGENDPPQTTDSNGNGNNSSNGHNAPPPPPPPIPTCPDLAISSYGYVAAVPGQPALAADEVAIQFEVRNAGTASYMAAANGQALTLTYNTPGGPHQVASTALPPSNGQANSVSAELGPHATWHGYLRATLTPADRRWPLHLKVDYGASGLNVRGLANDCNLDNNEIILVRP